MRLLVQRRRAGIEQDYATWANKLHASKSEREENYSNFRSASMSSMFKLSEINRNSLFAVIVCGSNIFLFSHSQRVVVVVVSLPGIEVLWVAIAHLLCARLEICVRFTSDHQCAIRANEMYTPNGANVMCANMGREIELKSSAATTDS